MISGPYHIKVERGVDGWYVKEFSSEYNEWGPYRWRWQARIIMTIVREM